MGVDRLSAVEGELQRAVLFGIRQRDARAGQVAIAFFADDGEYQKYVLLRDTKKRSGGRSKDKLGYAYDLTIRVLRAELKARLKADNVID